MFRPAHIVIGARAVLALGGACLAALMLMPMFSGAEGHFGFTDKQAHALAFYVFTSIGFLAAPRMRRNDLAIAAVAIGAAMEVAQAVTGRDGNFPDLAADSVGVLFAWGPTQIERIRGLVRSHPGLSFRQIRALDRRRPRAPGRERATAVPQPQ